MVIKSKKLPVPGETILGGTFLMNPGGKGANQAVAAARLQGQVTFVAKTGNDVFGSEARHLFDKEHIDTRFLISDDKNPSGVALINVDDHGENCIVVAPGSNGTLAAYDINEEVFKNEKEDIFLMQLEIPLGTVEYVALKASSKGNRVILNPAPARHLSSDLLSSLFMIIPNETEAELLTGVKVTDAASAETAAKKLYTRGVKNIVITMGGNGSFVFTPSVSRMISVVPVKAVDTTAAGDVFCGAVAVAIAEGKSIEDAVMFANKAAGISVTRLGAQASAPYREEIMS